jgi:hypothetical protein
VLPRNALTHLYWKVIGWYMLASVALAIYIAIATGIVAFISGGLPPAGAVEKNIPLLVLTGLGYLGLVLSLNVAIRVYLLRDLWATVLRSVQVYNVRAAANVAAKGEPATALGEGFADGLDVAGF